LNVPYVVMPIYTGVRFLRERRAARNKIKVSTVLIQYTICRYVSITLAAV